MMLVSHCETKTLLPTGLWKPPYQCRWSQAMFRESVEIPFNLSQSCENNQKPSQDLCSVTPFSNRMSTPPASGHAPKGTSQPHLQLASSSLTRLLIVACAGREQSRICWWKRQGWARETREGQKLFPCNFKCHSTIRLYLLHITKFTAKNFWLLVISKFSHFLQAHSLLVLTFFEDWKCILDLGK